MFCKLEAYIQSVHTQGLVPWKKYKDIPSSKLYNMDELGTDTTKRRGKVKTSSNILKRMFQIIPEDDGRMNMHVTVCLTTRTDGTSRTSLLG